MFAYKNRYLNTFADLQVQISRSKLSEKIIKIECCLEGNRKENEQCSKSLRKIQTSLIRTGGCRKFANRMHIKQN